RGKAGWHGTHCIVARGRNEGTQRAFPRRPRGHSLARLAACAGHGAPAFPLQRRRTAAARREKVLNGAPLRRAGDSHHDERKPRVFWAGIAASSNLKTLAADIEGAMEKCGIAREKRDFSPHLTLARLERPLPEALRKAIAENARREFGPLRTGEFHLVQ